MKQSHKEGAKDIPPVRSKPEKKRRVNENNPHSKPELSNKWSILKELEHGDLVVLYLKVQGGLWKRNK